MKKPTASVCASHLNTGTGIPDEELAWPETSGRVTRLPRLHVEIATFHGHALRGSGAGDGEEDSTDACPDTPPGEAVDQAGCSLVQVCASVDPGAKQGGGTCTASDWRNDVPLGAAGDCAVEKQSGICVPR